MCFTTKTLKVCHPDAAAAAAAAAVSVLGLFQVQADFRAADNPTVTTTDCVELMYARPETACPLSLSPAALSPSFSLCHDSYVPPNAQTQTDS